MLHLSSYKAQIENDYFLADLVSFFKYYFPHVSSVEERFIESRGIQDDRPLKNDINVSFIIATNVGKNKRVTLDECDGSALQQIIQNECICLLESNSKKHGVLGILLQCKNEKNINLRYSKLSNYSEENVHKT